MIEHFGVARMTVRQAVQELRAEGLVVSEHGRGVFVRPVRQSDDSRQIDSRETSRQGKAAFTVEAEKSGYSPQVDNIVVTREKPNSTVAERLRVSTDDEVVVRSRRYLADERPIETAVSYIPAAFAEGTKIEQVDTGLAASTPVWKRTDTCSHDSPRKSALGCPPRRTAGPANRGRRSSLDCAPDGIRHQRRGGRSLRHSEGRFRVPAGIRVLGSLRLAQSDQFDRQRLLLL